MYPVRRTTRKEVSVAAPPSKAHTLRALFLSALADGTSTIHNPLLGADQLHAIECLRGLGVSVAGGADALTVAGCNGAFRPAADELNAGESGVTMNFLLAVANLASRPVVITGTPRLRERPVGEIVGGLRQLGCRLDFVEREGFPPVRVHGGGIPGGAARMSGQITSQYFSAVAAAAPYARTPVQLHCAGTMTERPYLEITLSMMSDGGVAVKRRDFIELSIPNDRRYRARDLRIEGDYSSASFFFEAAAICGMRVRVTGLSAASVQGDRAILPLFEAMGCVVRAEPDAVTVAGAGLHGIKAEMADNPDLVPPVAVAAAFAAGETRLDGVGHLRHKESDRIAAIISELAKMGVGARCDESSLTICGGRPQGARIHPHNDHRIAMSFAVAGLAVEGQQIEDEACVAKSFPDFWKAFGAFEG